MPERKLGRVCPACGLRRSVFEPYTDRISAGRRFVLELDLHPILVHFPQAFCSVLPFLVLATILLPNFYREELIIASILTTIVLPPTVIAALIAGLIDAKTKFKKLSAPAVVRKIVIGSVLLALSTGNAAIVLLCGLRSGAQGYVLLLAVASLVCAVLLGMIGKRLIAPILPG